MITRTGLLIKVNEGDDIFNITRQSIVRGSDVNIVGKNSFNISSVCALECHRRKNRFFVHGSAMKDDVDYEPFSRNKDMIQVFFLTLIFPVRIFKNSAFKYTKNVIL